MTERRPDRDDERDRPERERPDRDDDSGGGGGGKALPGDADVAESGGGLAGDDDEPDA
jgi:hypothetical protein